MEVGSGGVCADVGSSDEDVGFSVGSSDGAPPLQPAQVAGRFDILYQPTAVDGQELLAKSPVLVQ